MLFLCWSKKIFLIINFIFDGSLNLEFESLKTITELRNVIFLNLFLTNFFIRGEEATGPAGHGEADRAREQEQNHDNSMAVPIWENIQISMYIQYSKMNKISWT